MYSGANPPPPPVKYTNNVTFTILFQQATGSVMTPPPVGNLRAPCSMFLKYCKGCIVCIFSRGEGDTFNGQTIVRANFCLPLGFDPRFRLMTLTFCKEPWVVSWTPRFPSTGNGNMFGVKFHQISKICSFKLTRLTSLCNVRFKTRMSTIKVYSKMAAQ